MVRSSSPAAVVPLSAIGADVQLQGVVAQPTAGQVAGAGESELAQLTASRVLGMAEIGVPPPCIAVLSEAGVHAGSVADLPWEVLESTVSSISGVGVAHLTLLRALHSRLQAARAARSSKSGSRSNSKASSKAGSRSGLSGYGLSVAPSHVSQSVAFGSQLQQGAGGVATADLGSQFAAADASAGAAFAGTAAVGLDPFAVTVTQPGSSPWMMRFPTQPTGAGTAAGPIWLGDECGLAGCVLQCWERPDGSTSEACCVEHARQMAIAKREARGGGLESPAVAAPAGEPMLSVSPGFQQAGQQGGAPVSPVAYRGATGHTPLCAIEECMRPRYVTEDGVLLDCCGITHGRLLLVRQTLEAAADDAQGATGGFRAPPPDAAALQTCSDAALRPLIFSFFLSFLGIYILWTHAQCLLDTCGL